MSILNLNAEIIYVFINLVILLLLMKKFLFGPVTRMLDERSKEIADTIDGANAKMDAAEKSRQEYEAQLLNAKKEAQDIVDAAKKRGQQEYEAQLAKARGDIARMQADAQKQAQADRDALLEGARQEIAMLALLAASKVSQQKMNSQADRDLVNAFLAEVEETA